MLLLIRLWDFKGGLDLFRYSDWSICSRFDVSSGAFIRFALLRRALIYTEVLRVAVFLHNIGLFVRLGPGTVWVTNGS